MRQNSAAATGNAVVDERPVTRAKTLAEQLSETRKQSLALAAPLSPEDMVVQAMDDASPAKWHLAHVTWFFENFVLKPHLEGYRLFDDTLQLLLQFLLREPRSASSAPEAWASDATVGGTRPCLSRPCRSTASKRSRRADAGSSADVARLLEIGINHEQQHQELLLTDILALFAANPLRPAYQAAPAGVGRVRTDPVRWIDYSGGIHRVGHAGDSYCWDNELPSHDALVHPFSIADRLVTNAEWLAFMEDGGYATPSLWLADGWATINREGWQAPLYWEETDAGWFQMSLQGLQPVVPAEPVAHVSYYEADAFARWAGKRLPTEFEWEVAAARATDAQRNTMHPAALRPRRAELSRTDVPRQLFGDVWQWTASAYLPYPGYKPPAGAIGEYNGKFMVSQQVLRGASCVTPRGPFARRPIAISSIPISAGSSLGLRLASEID